MASAQTASIDGCCIFHLVRGNASNSFSEDTCTMSISFVPSLKIAKYITFVIIICYVVSALRNTSMFHNPLSYHGTAISLHKGVERVRHVHVMQTPSCGRGLYNAKDNWEMLTGVVINFFHQPIYHIVIREKFEISYFYPLLISDLNPAINYLVA